MIRVLKISVFLAIGLSLLVAGCDNNPTEPEEEMPITITIPSDGDVLMVPITILAHIGSGYSITDVEFYIDGSLRWIDNNAPFEYYWNIYEYENNSEHTITATGYTADTSYTSSQVSVTISLEEGLAFVSTYRPATDQTFGVTDYGGIMFVATGSEGVEVIDISDITFPQYISRFESEGQALKVDAQYPDLFIADLSGGAIRTDFSDPDSLVETGSYSIDVQANDIAISGDIAFVADQNGFIVLDNTVSDSLVSLFRSELFSGSNYVIARNDTAYITNISNLYIIDATIPESPSIVSTYNTSGFASSIALVDTFVFVGDGSEGVISLSISDPEVPEYLARYDVVQANVSAVETGDSTLFIGTFSGEVIALDYTQADTLIAIDNLVIQDASINHLHYDSPYLFAAGLDGVSIIRFIR
jgi:hypothetical protein